MSNKRYAQQLSCVGIKVDADPVTQLISDELRAASSFPRQARVRARAVTWNLAETKRWHLSGMPTTRPLNCDSQTLPRYP